MNSKQFCLPCQIAIRSGRVSTISGPQYPSTNLTLQLWRCSLCITIQAMGLPAIDRTRRSRPSAWYIGFMKRLERRLASSARGMDRMEVCLDDPLQDKQYLAAVSNNAPIPPVGDLDDIIVMSHQLTHSACRNKSDRCDDSKIVMQTPSVLRVVPEAKIDRSLVKRWLSECVEKHSICGAGKHDSHAGLLVVDVRRKCLVTTTNARYFALSYVWGKADQFLLQQENLAELSKDGALQQRWDKLADVLKDAINFVESLSEQYLWVDTLCIIQDSPGRHTYLSRMNEVYQGATCTLVAMDSTDARSALPGVQVGSRITQSVGHASSLNVVRKRSSLASAFATSVYESRAWTFQERTLSSRCLYFMKEQVYFQCQESIWSEDRYEDIEQDFDLEGVYPSLQWIGQHTKASDYSKFSAYSQLVTHYSKRDLSYSTDRLNAFSGIISSLERAWDWKLVAGMPPNFLDQALLWGPTKARRRVHTTNMEQYLPSWSWAGWTGDVRFSRATSTLSMQIWRFVVTTATGAIDIQFPDGDVPYSLVETTKEIIPPDAPDDMRLTSVSYQLRDMPNLLMFHAEIIRKEALKQEDIIQLDDAYDRYRYILMARTPARASIMLIRATGKGYSERVAVRTMGIQGWYDLNPVYEKICLG